MSALAQAQSSSPPVVAKFILKVVSGPDMGATFQLFPPQATLGRGVQNDVALSDPRCSRTHAVIEFSENGTLIRDLTGKVGISVNGKLLQQSFLVHGDRFKVGTSELIVNIVASQGTQPPPPLGLHNIQPPGLNASSNFRLGPLPGERNRAKNNGQDGRLRFYLIVGVIGVAVTWFVMSSSKSGSKDNGLRSQEKFESELADAGNRVDALRKRRDMAPEERARFLEADRHYHEGFRDYQSGNYERALKSFEIALVIEPRHEMARYYQSQASRWRDEEISSWMKEGRNYRERDMYARCMAALDKVIKAVPSSQDPRRRESQVLRDECEALDRTN